MSVKIRSQALVWRGRKSDSVQACAQLRAGITKAA
ncbi:hypothetical protein LTSEJOH_3471, partial [Salmonella enterica subsp. enterica serovar Johannesburg str. S5-703]